MNAKSDITTVMGIFIPGGPVDILATNSVDVEDARDLVE